MNKIENTISTIDLIEYSWETERLDIKDSNLGGNRKFKVYKTANDYINKL